MRGRCLCCCVLMNRLCILMARLVQMSSFPCLKWNVGDSFWSVSIVNRSDHHSRKHYSYHVWQSVRSYVSIRKRSAFLFCSNSHVPKAVVGIPSIYAEKRRLTADDSLFLRRTFDWKNCAHTTQTPQHRNPNRKGPPGWFCMRSIVSFRSLTASGITPTSIGLSSFIESSCSMMRLYPQNSVFLKDSGSLGLEGLT